MISVIISGIIFHFEEDGYNILKNYLETIQRNLKAYNEPSRIMAYIENVLAETFLNKLKDGIQVVTTEDVEECMATKEELTKFKNIKRTNRVYLF